MRIPRLLAAACALAALLTLGYPLAKEQPLRGDGLGYDEKTVQRLAEIAPTYSVNAFDGQNWLVHFKETAAALGRTDAYDAWMATYEARVAEVKAAVGDKAKEVISISSEQVGRLADVDLAFATTSPGGHYTAYDMEMTYGSPSGQLAFLDVVEKAFADV